jgi:hypothetical protein
MPAPQKIRKQRFRLAAAAAFFGCLGLAFVAIAAASWVGSFLWVILVGR